MTTGEAVAVCAREAVASAVVGAGDGVALLACAGEGVAEEEDASEAEGAAVAEAVGTAGVGVLAELALEVSEGTGGVGVPLRL